MSDKKVRPWDIFNKNVERALPIVQEQRINICKACPEFVRFTAQCKKCGCFMNAKTKLLDASCPIGKWEDISKKIAFDREMSDEDIKNIKG